MPATAWYIEQSGRTFGPYTTDQVCTMVATGRLRPDDLVRKQGYLEWSKVSTMAELAGALTAKPAGKTPPPAPGRSAAEPRTMSADGQPVGDPGKTQAPAARTPVESNQSKVEAAPDRPSFRKRFLPVLVMSNILCLGVLVAVATYMAMTGGSRDGGGDAKVIPVVDDTPKAPTYETDVQPLLAKYCYTCHNAEKHKAGLALDKYTTEASIARGRKTWLGVVSMLDKHEMPPEEKPQPTNEERKFLVDWITAAADKLDCNGPINPGRVTIRRLNRVEYRNTVRDLVGIDYELTEDFPADDVGYGYDNIGDVLSISPLLMERYLAAAEEITNRIFSDRLPAAVDKGGTRYDGDRLSVSSGVDEAGGGAKGLSSSGEVRAEHEVKREGEYVIHIEAWGDRGDGVWPNMAVSIDGKHQQDFEVNVRRNEAKTFDLKTTLSAGKHRIAAAFTNDYYNPNHPDRRERDRNLYISYIAVDGPTNVRPPAAAAADNGATKSPFDRLMIAYPSNGTKDEQGNLVGIVTVDEAARLVIAQLATRAFRRPATDDEVQRVVDFVKLAIEQGDTYERGIQLAAQAVLVSPHFLFRVEQDRAPDDPKHPIAGYTLDDYELASRLSYFIYSSMPDDELIAAASRGELGTDAQIEAQVRRMLADPRSQALVQNFGGQWLQTRNVASVSPDPKKFDWDEDLRKSMVTETLKLFESVMRDDASVLRFLDADYTFLNERLAKHYGIDRPQGTPSDEFVKVSLIDTPRRGVLSQASILTITSDPNRTSPVKRGKWVMEQILGTPPPPPPGNAPPLPEEVDGKPITGTLRERMEKHLQNATCRSCHERMDPLGLAFEHFDAVGRWRDIDGGSPIDASGQLPDGREFNNAAELVQLLMADKDLFVRNLSEQMLTYAIGRGPEYYDKCAVDKMMRQVADSDYRFSSLVLAIATSDPFRKRTAKDVTDE